MTIFKDRLSYIFLKQDLTHLHGPTSLHRMVPAADSLASQPFLLPDLQTYSLTLDLECLLSGNSLNFLSSKSRFKGFQLCLPLLLNFSDKLRQSDLQIAQSPSGFSFLIIFIASSIYGVQYNLSGIKITSFDLRIVIYYCLIASFL